MRLRGLILVLVLCLLGGCGTVQVAEDLNQNQANEIVAVLNGSGISAVAERESGGRSKYRVSVDAEHHTAAVAILNDKGLPRRSRFEEQIEQRGLLPNSRELEALRVDHARATEIAEILETHPGISSVQVGVSKESQPPESEPGVAIIIHARAGGSVNGDEVRTLIAQLVPGIKPENIAVSIHQADIAGNVFVTEGAVNQDGKVIRVPLASFLFGWRVAEDDYAALAGAVLGFVFTVGILGAALGYSYGAYRRSVPEETPALPEPAIRSGRFDKTIKNLPEL